jgi:hypothetical protein
MVAIRALETRGARDASDVRRAGQAGRARKGQFEVLGSKFRTLQPSVFSLQLFRLLHNSRIPSEAIIFLVTKSLRKRYHLMVGIEIMAFLLSVMFKHER